MGILKSTFLLDMTKQEEIFALLKKQFSSLNTAMAEATTIQECFTAWGFTTELFKFKILTLSRYDGNGLGLEFFFMLLAPYVQDNGKIVFEGEENEPITFKFYHGECAIEL